jgi:8-oxo-dGTP pyrophosphatase MutT (NUDIX family)
VAAPDTSFTDPNPRRVGALWLIVDDQTRVLVVQPSYRPTNHYQLVGGCANPGEPPHQAAIREGYEEIGVPMVPDTFLIADYTPANKATRSAEGLNFVWLHRMSPHDTISLKADAPKGVEPELIDFRWLRPDELDEHCTPAQATRIRAALAAAADPAHRGYHHEGQTVTYPTE